MKLFLFEIRKNILKSVVLIALILFSLVNVIQIYSLYRTYAQFPGEDYLKGRQEGRQAAYTQLYQRLRGEINDEKIGFVVDEYARLKNIINEGRWSTEYDPDTYTGYIFGDYTLFKYELYSPMKESYHYKSYAGTIVSKALENIDFYKERNNHYEARKNQMIAGSYRNRAVTHFYNTNGYETLLYYDFSSLLIILMCILVLTPVFVNEKESNMQPILLASKKGKTPTLMAKYLSSCVFIVCISLYFYGLDYLSFFLRYGLEGGGNPLYGIELFKETPLNTTILGHFFLSSVLKILGILTLSLFFLFFSSLFNSNLYPFTISIAFSFLLIYLSDFADHKLISIANPIALIHNRELLRVFDVFDILGRPTMTYLVAIAVMLIYCTILIAITVYLSRKTFVMPNFIEKEVKKHG